MSKYTNPGSDDLDPRARDRWGRFVPESGAADPHEPEEVDDEDSFDDEDDLDDVSLDEDDGDDW